MKGYLDEVTKRFAMSLECKFHFQDGLWQHMPAIPAPQVRNRPEDQMNSLGNESSLYLRQHADNPVDWHPWCDAALERAREQDRPILLSIGYSACHWCHVMAHESFEDTETAGLMNGNFINVKVDREERPDLDRIYQLAHQLLTGRGGGWPLTVFLEPVELVPFFAGTYFPPERRYGMPSFKEVLSTLHQWYGEHRGEVREQNGKLREALDSIQNPTVAESDVPDAAAAQEIFQSGAEQVYSLHDRVNGGFGGAPKFPQAPLLNAVACLGAVESGDSLDRSLEFTLEKMALSGLRDHLDGGFFRYCVDENWTIPHFEKMLYDNAMLLPLYAEGAARWNNPLLKSTAEGIIAWLESVMKQESGGYAASIDADAGGEEGGFHVWRREEIQSELSGKTRELFMRSFGLDEAPNFEGQSWHLQQRVPPGQLAREFDESEASVIELLSGASRTLRTARESRVHPTLDDKRLTSWNALLAEGFVRAARALGREDWMDPAREIFDFIRRELWTGERLMAVYHSGTARFEAYVDDYAWLLNALTLSLQARWDRDILEFAMEIAGALLEWFEDEESGGFYFSDVTVDVPIMRTMYFQDDATPAGNAIAIPALNRLGRLLGDVRYTTAADRCLQRAAPRLTESPLACPSLLAALRDSVNPPRHVVISGTGPDRQFALKRWVDGRDRVDCYLIGPPDETLPGILREYRSDEPVTAWLCRGMHCLPPVNSLEELEQQLV
jgi:uncharacterized protein YyaL (SSP411 family)